MATPSLKTGRNKYVKERKEGRDRGTLVYQEGKRVSVIVNFLYWVEENKNGHHRSFEKDLPRARKRKWEQGGCSLQRSVNLWFKWNQSLTWSRAREKTPHERAEGPQELEGVCCEPVFSTHRGKAAWNLSYGHLNGTCTRTTPGDMPVLTSKFSTKPPP